MREETLARTTELVQQLEPNARVHIFGSCATGLRLPFGDLDLMVEAPDANNRLLFSRMARQLRRTKTAVDLMAIPTARVPIIRWTDRASRVRCDACINNFDGLRNTAMLARDAADLPAMRPLALIFKSQLLMHDLHSTVNGGVGGYLLSHMLRHVLLMAPPPAREAPFDPFAPGQSCRDDLPPFDRGFDAHAGADAFDARGLPPTYDDDSEAPEDLGGMLLRAYWHYGIKHNPQDSIVTMAQGGAHRGRPEDSMRSITRRPGQSGHVSHAPGVLSLMDPAAPDRDIGAKAYRYGLVRKLLRHSYLLLSEQVRLHRAWAARGGALTRDDEPPLLSAILPRWKKRHGKRDARQGQKRLAQVRRRRQRDDERFCAVANELGSGAIAADPLWGVG